ncbi:serine/threonine protein kinase [Polyangium spumosum]|nr:serine/threonine-protein kinase [Polyangium spumosum]
MKLEEGAILGDYRIVRILGRGGMGVVYVADSLRQDGLQVAIKVLSQATVELHGDALARFEREAQAAGQIGSDHIVEVLDVGTTEAGDRFMVMELLEGETLKARAKRGRISIDKIVELFRQLLDGLEAAHVAGIIHRDLKPDNVFLQKKDGREEWVKILDFGISKFSGLAGEAASHTRTGVVMGTPFYMSPEQARSANSVDTRSDLYTVGVMLYEMLTGQVPFKGETFAELMFKIVFEPQPHPKSQSPLLDDEICGIVVKGMQRDPAARFQSAAEFRDALVAWEEKRAAGSLKRTPLPSIVDVAVQPPPPSVRTPEPPPLSTPPDEASLAGPTSSPSGPPSSTLGPTSAPTSASQTRQTWAQSERSSVPAGKRKGGLVAASLAAVVAVSAGGAYVFLRGNPGPPALPPPAAAAPVPTPEPETTTPPPAASTAAPTPAESASAAPAESASVKPASSVAPTQVAPTKKSVTKKVVTDYGY